MRMWLVAVAVLFVLGELFDWVKGFMLPLPVYLLAGAFLAIASNYEKGIRSFLPPTSEGEKTISETNSNPHSAG